MKRDKEESEETAAAETKTKPAAVVPVNVIGFHGPSVLVEWNDAGTARRGIVPAETLTGGAVSAETLSAAAPYGMPWQDILSGIRITAEELAAALRNAGVWTMDDLRANPRAVQSALTAVLGLEISGVIIAAETYTKGKQTNE